MMSSHDLTAYLMGGLGNQMFQYAAARGLAHKNGANLYLDTVNGFARDKVYKRTYELGTFPIASRVAGPWRRMPFVAEMIERKLTRRSAPVIRKRVFGASIVEPAHAFLPDVAAYRMEANTWMWGYWQSERYFSHIAREISRELMPPAPKAKQFVDCAHEMASCEAVAVGVRLFEEVPSASKEGVGGVTPIERFNAAAAALADKVRNPEFFVFCTTRSPQLQDLQLPGPVNFITHEDGFEGTTERLWLLTQCRHHIISNSSFYWWGAWLREAVSANCQIFASRMFSNPDAIPARWTAMDSL